MTNNENRLGQNEKPHDPQAEMETLVYHITHDLRASARALREIPSWVSEDLQKAQIEMPEEIAGYLGLMERHAIRLDQMLADLLVYSRVGRMQEIGLCKMSEALHRALQNSEIPRGVEIVQKVDDCSVHMGERDLLTLLQSLLSNALKHGVPETGQIDILCSETNGTVTISIIDTGPGIEPKYRAKVFTVMTTLQPRDEVEGSGMGLAIAEKICRINHGAISLDDTQAGCSVTVKLPAA